jgi:hypothetical protein
MMYFACQWKPNKDLATLMVVCWVQVINFAKKFCVKASPNMKKMIGILQCIIIFFVRTFSRWDVSNNILDLVVSTVMF